MLIQFPLSICQGRGRLFSFPNISNSQQRSRSKTVAFPSEVLKPRQSPCVSAGFPAKAGTRCQMHKLFLSHYPYLYSSFKSCCKSPRFIFPISLLHSSKQSLDPNLMQDFVFDEVESRNSSSSVTRIAQSSSKTNELINQAEHTKRNESTVQISHPWPEWVDLMELLLKRGYFTSNMNPFLNGELGTKEMNWIRTACLNFARDQLGLVR